MFWTAETGVTAWAAEMVPTPTWERPDQPFADQPAHCPGHLFDRDVEV